jgi:glycosyltransferase-like protein LARGE
MQLSEKSKQPAGPNDAMHTYSVQNEKGYEPYVIVHRDTFIPYNERFRGYVFNKIVQLRWMAHRGATYHVLPRHFVVEQKHRNGQNYKNVVQKRGPASRLWKTFEQARVEMEAGAFPALSNTTRRLYQEYQPHRMLS